MLLDRSWLIVCALSMTVTVSYGVLMYAFPVMLAPMQAELGWSPALLTCGFSVAALASGAAAIPVGRWIDRYGPRAVMTTGSAAAAALVFAWSRVHDPLSYVLVWIGLGAAMAAVFYEPAFAVVARRFHTQRARALSIITLAGGLASTIFVPLASWLVVSAGWRSAVMCLALTLAAFTILPHAMLPRSASVRCTRCDTESLSSSVSARDALRSVQFRWLAASSFLSTLASFAVAVHLIPLLLEQGSSVTTAAAALALLGLAKLPGRALVVPVAARCSARTVAIAILAVQVIGLIALGVLEDAVGMWIFVALFGAGDGAATPARGELIAELFGLAEYGRIGGLLAFVLSLARFIAPAGASLVHAMVGGYGGVLWILALAVCGAAVAMSRVRPQGLHEGVTPGDAASASFCGVCRLSP